MLFPANPMLLEVIKHETAQRCIRQAQIDQLVRESEPSKQRGLISSSGERIEQLGLYLMAWGKRLERIGTRQSA